MALPKRSSGARSGAARDAADAAVGGGTLSGSSDTAAGAGAHDVDGAPIAAAGPVAPPDPRAGAGINPAGGAVAGDGGGPEDTDGAPVGGFVWQGDWPEEAPSAGEDEGREAAAGFQSTMVSPDDAVVVDPITGEEQDRDGGEEDEEEAAYSSYLTTRFDERRSAEGRFEVHALGLQPSAAAVDALAEGELDPSEQLRVVDAMAHGEVSGVGPSGVDGEDYAARVRSALDESRVREEGVAPAPSARSGARGAASRVLRGLDGAEGELSPVERFEQGKRFKGKWMRGARPLPVEEVEAPPTVGGGRAFVERGCVLPRVRRENASLNYLAELHARARAVIEREEHRLATVRSSRVTAEEQRAYMRLQNAARRGKNRSDHESRLTVPVGRYRDLSAQELVDRDMARRQIASGTPYLLPSGGSKGGGALPEASMVVLAFLAKFRAATTSQIAMVLRVKESSAKARLYRLRKAGLVVSEVLYGPSPMHFLTDWGARAVGLNIKNMDVRKVNPTTLPHRLVVNHVAASLYGAGMNVLNLSDYPQRNRVGTGGERVWGETLVSEFEIQSSLAKQRRFDKMGAYQARLMDQMDTAFSEWERRGGVRFGNSPEWAIGNEYMLAVYLDPDIDGASYHVPDLAVLRPRAQDGSSRSIAVEVELGHKTVESYEQSMLAYKKDNRMYGHHVWVCGSSDVMKRLQDVAVSLGLHQGGRVSILPVFASDGGVFRGKWFWELGAARGDQKGPSQE